MLVLAIWVNVDSPIKLIPYIDDQIIADLKIMKVEDVADFMNMEDEDRSKILSRFSLT